MGVLDLTRATPDGARLGQSTADLVGFYGITVPIAQPTGSTRVTTAGAMNTTAMRESLNRVITVLENLNLISTLGYNASI